MPRTRLNIKIAGLKDAGEEATKAQLDQVNKARARIGRKSEQIGEATLDDILTRRVLIEDAIAKTEKEIRLADLPEQKKKLESELAFWKQKLMQTDTEGMLQSMGYQRIYPPAGSDGVGSGDVDRIYLKTDGGKKQVMEVKGGQNQLSSRELSNLGQLDAQFAGERAQQGNGLYLLDIIVEMEKKGIPEAKVLRKALFDGDLAYGHFHLKFTKEGVIGPLFLQNFDITDAYQNQQLLNGTVQDK